SYPLPENEAGNHQGITWISSNLKSSDQLLISNGCIRHNSWKLSLDEKLRRSRTLFSRMRLETTKK
ncbi:5507_t:CDS:2, partial [Acaulospora morrowiae]